MSRRAKITIAEDSPTQAIFLQGMLEQHDFVVEHGKNGQEALDLIRADMPDLVITDLEMPEMDGLELVSALQQEPRSPPVILVTAVGSEEVAAAALRAGATSYVPKTDLENELTPTIERILAVVDADRASLRLAPFIESTATNFTINNDLTLVPLLVARIQTLMQDVLGVSEGDLFQIATAIDESLTNAIVHGNLEVSSELRSVDDGSGYEQLINERLTLEPYQSRRVHVQVAASREEASITIRDEGPGFDPSSVPDPTDPANLEKVSGRGLLLINAFMDEVTHNDKGNEIRMTKRRSEPARRSAS